MFFAGIPFPDPGSMKQHSETLGTAYVLGRRVRTWSVSARRTGGLK